MKYVKILMLLVLSLLIFTGIVACSNGGGSNSNDVESVSLTSITINADTSQIAKNTSTNLIATGVFSDGTTKNLTNQVSWISSNPSILQVSESGVASGLVAGNVNVTANYNGLSSSSLQISVTDATLKQIVVNAEQSSIAKGTATQLTATGVFSDDTMQNLTGQVAWSSSDIDVADVTSEGVLVASDTGGVDVTASLLGGGVVFTYYNYC